MYEEHSIFKQPDNENDKVWRYMDFTKLISLLESSSLYFTRADMFDDSFEGSYPRGNILMRKYIPDNIPSEDRDTYLKSMVNAEDINRQWPKHIAINCWHLNNHESAAMWRLYLKSNEGIAIQTSYNKLRNSFSSTSEVIYIGLVKYIDYETQYIPDNNLLSPFVHKRKSFEHEKEIRAVIIKWPLTQDGDSLNFSVETISHGLNISVDINSLIEKIYIAPDAPLWFSKLVKSVVERYGYDFEVIHSNLNQQPLY